MRTVQREMKLTSSARMDALLPCSRLNDTTPVSVLPLDDRQATVGVGMCFTVPEGSFADGGDGDALTYEATLADGSDWPEWLQFDSETGTFSGMPTDTGAISVTVTAWDSTGRSASDTFDIVVQPALPSLAGTANADVLAGTTGNNTLTGLGGDDHLNGDSGADLLYGGAGNDTLEGDALDSEAFVRLGTLAVHARGSAVDGIYPTMEVWVDGVKLETFTVDSDEYTVYELSLPPGLSAREVAVVFTNDAWKPELGQDRNLYVDQIVVNGQPIKGNASGAVVDFGNGIAAFDGINTIASYGNIYSNGSLRFSLSGSDLLDGGAGIDTMRGGIGNDVYVVDTAGDLVVEGADAGYDLVKSSISYVLPDNVEALTLLGTADLAATGNAGQNTLTGNAGANRLDGGAGKDYMSGGAGDDTYVVNDGGDIVTEGLNAGSDTVISSAKFTLGNNVENLTLTGASAINGNGNALDNLLIGNGGDNTLRGNAGNDVLQGRAGSDMLYGGHGNDTLEGDDTAANSLVSLDTLVVHARGSAVDGVYPTMEVWADGVRLATVTVDVTTSSAYSIAVPAGTLAREVSVRFTNDAWKPELGQDRNLYVDQIVVNGQDIKSTAPGVMIDFGNGAAALDGINTILSYGNVYSNGAMRFTLAGSDLLDGGLGADTMRGGIGNDVYVVDDAGDVIIEDAAAGYDLVKSSISYVLGDGLETLTLTGTASIDGTGNAAHNLMVGNSGANRLDGGAGNDNLQGGLGDDTYVFGRGYGVDTVTDNDSTAGNTDIASFLSGIGTDQIWFRHVGTALEVSIIGTSDKLTISNWYSGSQYHVEQFKTADGQMLLDNQVETLVQAMAAFSPPAAGQTTLPSNYQTALQPVLVANWQ